MKAVYCRMITRAIEYFLWFGADARFFAMEEGWHAPSGLQQG